ncbi:hypothetical protein B0T17DRAFT_505884 [Bombardia bombarda]|uniref:Uncharacterized protein n=1 Tax=Bombardia bombarda TaxID=252184 RepID=A0AA39X8L2_9PEZI|nr:hypothetical protein B0T17DRAFT_505884 [Bombardia bombarda]
MQGSSRRAPSWPPSRRKLPFVMGKRMDIHVPLLIFPSPGPRSDLGIDAKLPVIILLVVSPHGKQGEVLKGDLHFTAELLASMGFPDPCCMASFAAASIPLSLICIDPRSVMSMTLFTLTRESGRPSQGIFVVVHRPRPSLPGPMSYTHSCRSIAARG